MAPGFDRPRSLGLLIIVDLKKRMVPRVGVEPTWALSPLDFESSAYTNFATPA